MIVDLSTGRASMVEALPLRREEDVGFGMVNLFKTEIEVAMEMLDLLKGPFLARVVFDPSTGPRSS